MSRLRIPTLVLLFGLAGLVGGASAGAQQDGWEGALLGGFVGGVVGTIVGRQADQIARLVKRIGASKAFDRNVRRPDFWGIPYSCLNCGWKVGSEGPWRVRDCFSPPRACPSCGGPLHRVVPDCPECGTVPNHVRLLTTWRQVVWRGYTCRQCGTDFNKWGRRHDPTGASER